MDDYVDVPEEGVLESEETAEEIQASAMIMLMKLAESEGDISGMLDEGQLTQIGGDAIDNYQDDLAERDDWERIAKGALEKASQEKPQEDKTYPWHHASNVNYPLLTVAALQFNARAYPAIVKGDEAASAKVVGADKGQPALSPDGQPMMQFQGMSVIGTEQGPAIMSPQGFIPLPAGAQPEPVWQRKPGAKAARAQRVKEYMNTHLFYRMEDWESETDLLLMQLPIVGCAFRKVYYDAVSRKHCSKLVTALNLIAPSGTKDCKTAARLSEVLPDQYPYQILENIRSGFYRSVNFIEGEKFTENPRALIEQHCRIDLDGDGYPEPYVVTVDIESREVVRIVSNFAAGDILAKDGRVISIKARQYYVKYGFFPHPEGKFYDLGLGHLLEQIGGVIDTIINQLVDAGTAQVAGGGFIGSGVRLQGSNRSSTIRMAPGEYKTVNVPGDQLRNAIVDRTLPTVSPVQYQILEMMLGAAQDISSIKDVLTGDASNNGQVGTTLALIEQGLQMFTAIYKRVYRGLKAEFQLLFESLSAYGDEETARDYMELLDDPEADFAADFNSQDMDIRPVSDPNTVTNMQRVARGNFLMSTAPMAVEAMTNPVLREILKRVYESADIDNVEDLLIEAPAPPPNPAEVAAAQKDLAQAGKYAAETLKTEQDIEIERVEKAAEMFMKGHGLG